MAIVFVNASEGHSDATTTVATAASSLSAGNLNVVAVRYGNIEPNDITVTDTAGNLYRFVCDRAADDGARISIWYANDTIAEANNVVTATFASSSFYNDIVAAQLSGLATASPLDVFVFDHASAGAADITSPPFTTTVADEVIIMAAQVSATGGTWATASGFTVAITTAGGVMTVQYQIVSAIQSAATVTANPSSTATMCILVATFNEDAGGGGGGGGSFPFLG